MGIFFKSVCLLMGVAFLGECIEFLTNMVLAKELGEHGMGLYMSILPIIVLVIVIASMELPVSISKFIAEKDEKYHQSMLQHVIRLTVLFTIFFMAFCVVLLPFIPIFKHYHPFIRGLVIILIPIIAFSSIARGYFMGIQQMGKIATANFLRKIVQLLLLVFLYQWFHFSLEVSILVALCTIVGSDFIVLLYLLHMFVLQMKFISKKERAYVSGQSVRKNLLAVSLPTTSMRVFLSITNAIEPFLIKAAVVKSGMTETMANEHFGLMAGVAFTIGFFPAFIAHSLSTVLIPTVSEAYSKQDGLKLQKLLQKVMLVTFLYGVPAVICIYVFAEPLTNLFFHSMVAAIYLQLLWPYFLFHFFVIPMQAFLIGLGLIRDAFAHFIWSTIVTYLMMYFLGTNPEYQMAGIIIAMNTGALLLMLMHYLTICKKIEISLVLRNSVKHTF
ncbi:polysaccharide biosynthesis protein [Heyndrickxia ginsengihumi]|uniref:Multidrug transporter MatE n=1 Tax=Heyndrickxia ginsengihumi TaxID=363870 RepID=A0A0A6VBG7_9BACI|nr:polysaccharide biosynthesis protein [Heyndrickxia ginsengihumi]KHD85600.1 multidrug transporter MatE [Heyndrickxia ginsengihumi]MBE6182874.1 polysaccharide biosynthesis protein [Bacillus sp. (in: firmicutes)]MCM3023892.1 polysaccharide biosynthesis protein [Heyndrickxia ginsengihumi]NEY19865.1 polysaccharide biosynthesis protein [Heyndrickxia ginsengihumi]